MFKPSIDLAIWPWGDVARLERATKFIECLLHDFSSLLRFGDECYSREELVAEMGAAFLAGYCGIDGKTLVNSASYLANWLQALRNDSRMVVVAGSQAQKATD